MKCPLSATIKNAMVSQLHKLTVKRKKQHRYETIKGFIYSDVNDKQQAVLRVLVTESRYCNRDNARSSRRLHLIKKIRSLWLKNNYKTLMYRKLS